MPFDPKSLPDLVSDYESPQDKFKRKLDEQIAGWLGSDFSWKNGLRYDNGQVNALLNNRGFKSSIPVLGGKLDASVTNIGSGDPYFQLWYTKRFK